MVSRLETWTLDKHRNAPQQIIKFTNLYEFECVPEAAMVGKMIFRNVGIDNSDCGFGRAWKMLALKHKLYHKWDSVELFYLEGIGVFVDVWRGLNLRRIKLSIKIQNRNLHKTHWLNIFYHTQDKCDHSTTIHHSFHRDFHSSSGHYKSQ